MKSLILLTVVTSLFERFGKSQAISYDMHRHLEESDEPKKDLFQIETKDFIQAKFSIAPVSLSKKLF